MPRSLLLLVACLCPWPAGCFVPWAAPAYSRCPEVTVPTGGDEVVAIFVRATTEQHGSAPGPWEVHTFQRIPVADGEVPSQVRVYLARGYVIYIVYNGGSLTKREYCLTKLYRQGYKTVVVEPSRKTVEVRWEPADTPADQERAIHDFVYRVRWDGRDHKPELSPGSADPRHREVLLFAAGEYARVAELYPSSTEDRHRCFRAAQALRGRAAE